MLLNLSNHASINWGEEQIIASQKYGTIQDMNFPAIDPIAGKTYIENLTQEYLKKIKAIKESTTDSIFTIHIMGEQTFCYSLIKKLEAEGIQCIASTTEREVQITGDTKTVQFKFKRFREYI